jgi:hypothetical protein
VERHNPSENCINDQTNDGQVDASFYLIIIPDEKSSLQGPVPFSLEESGIIIFELQLFRFLENPAIIKMRIPKALIFWIIPGTYMRL